MLSSFCWVFWFLKSCLSEGDQSFKHVPSKAKRSSPLCPKSLSEGPTEDLELMDVSWTHTPSMTPWPFHICWRISLTLYQTLATNPNIRVQQCMQIIIISISSSSSKLCKQYQSISYTYHIIFYSSASEHWIQHLGSCFACFCSMCVLPPMFWSLPKPCICLMTCAQRRCSANLAAAMSGSSEPTPSWRCKCRKWRPQRLTTTYTCTRPDRRYFFWCIFLICVYLFVHSLNRTTQETSRNHM